MKKKVAVTLALILVFGIFAPGALQAVEISVTIDGANVDFEGQLPTLVDGRTLVPVRGVFEALGFIVDWEQDTLTATLTDDNYVVIISIGSDVFTTNGEEISLDVPAQIIEGRTLLPIRAVLESVGFDVDWDGVTSTVIIDTAGEMVLNTDTEAATLGSEVPNFEVPDNLDLGRLAFNNEMFSWVSVIGGFWEFGSIVPGEGGIIDMNEHGVFAVSTHIAPEEASAAGYGAAEAAMLLYYVLGDEGWYFLRSFTTFFISEAQTSAYFEIPVYISFNSSLNVVFYMGQEKPDGYVHSTLLIVDFTSLDEKGIAALEEFSLQAGRDFLSIAVESMQRYFNILSFADGFMPGN